MIIPAQLTEWRRIAEKAGDWMNDPGEVQHDFFVGFKKSDEDCEFIAHACNTYIQLLDEIERLRAALEKISDVTPFMHRPSYRDYELREIARDALEGK